MSTPEHEEEPAVREQPAPLPTSAPVEPEPALPTGRTKHTVAGCRCGNAA